MQYGHGLDTVTVHEGSDYVGLAITLQVVEAQMGGLFDQHGHGEEVK